MCSKSVQVRNKITVCVAFNIVWVAHYLTPNVDPKDLFLDFLLKATQNKGVVLLSSYLPCHLSKDGVWC